ncbi:hypothetical protein BN2497_527 [Janthinobacterium sp. CG23_2]|nr:hypothetical protein BN2497_527 [Janthinobacterium sp. CG23_2]CUU26661.1 hypothetical protein BN3177_527 [Janthinobacterium sp. CG23_2]
MQVSPYCLLGASTLAALAQRCNAMLDAWAGAWGVERGACTLECVRAWDSNALRPGQWQRHHAQAEQAVWIGWPDELARALQARLFPPDQRHAPLPARGASLAAETAAEACAALADALAAAAAPGVSAPADSGAAAPAARLFRRGSGAVVVALRIAEQAMLCVLNHACLDLPAPEKTRAAGAHRLAQGAGLHAGDPDGLPGPGRGRRQPSADPGRGRRHPSRVACGPAGDGERSRRRGAVRRPSGQRRGRHRGRSRAPSFQLICHRHLPSLKEKS